MKEVFLSLLLLCTCVHTATVVYVFPVVGGNYDFSSTGLWGGQPGPVNGDDVVFINTRGGQTIPPLVVSIGTITLNSFTILNNVGVTFQFTSLTITSNFTCDGADFVGVSGGGNLTFSPNSVISFPYINTASSVRVTFTNVQISNYGDLTYRFPSTTVGTSRFANFGTWKFNGGAQALAFNLQNKNENDYWGRSDITITDATPLNFNGVSTFVNYGRVDILGSNTTHNYYLNFENSGTINVEGVNVIIATRRITTVHLHNGTLNLDINSSWLYDSRSYVNCTGSAIHSGAGFMIFAGSDQEDIIYAIYNGQGTNCTVANLWLEGYVKTIGPANFVVDKLLWKGGSLNNNNWSVRSLDLNSPQRVPNVNSYFLTNNLTITGAFNYDVSSAAHFLTFNTGSFLNINLNATLNARNGNIGNPTNIAGSIINSGVIQAASSSFAQTPGTQFNTLVLNYGTVNGTPASTTAFVAGFVNYAVIASSWANSSLVHNSYDFVFGGSQPVQLSNGSSVIGGGYFGATGSIYVNGDVNFTKFRLFENGRLYLNDTRVVIFEGFLEAGNITGSGSRASIQVGNAYMLPNFVQTKPLRVEALNFNIIGSMTTASGTLQLVNGAKITVAPTGRLYVNYSSTPFFGGGSDSAAIIQNSGYIQFQGTAASPTTVPLPVINNGTIEIGNQMDSSAGGNIAFSNVYTASGVIRVRVSSPTSGDFVTFAPGSLPCVFSGTITFQFDYRPSAGDTYNFLEYQNGASGTKCTGGFYINAVNLPQGLTANIYYDYPTANSARNNAYMVICFSSNTTCATPQIAGNPRPTNSSATTLNASLLLCFILILYFLI